MKKRLTAYYLVLAAVTIAVAVVVFTAGGDTRAAAPIAGGYDVAAGAECLGPQVDIRQSGQFLDLRGGDGVALGRARLVDGRISGDIRCRGGGGEERIEATLGERQITGQVAERPLRADFKREPPEPGQQRPRPPKSVEGEYGLVPRAECLGSEVELEGGGEAVHVVRDGSRRGDLVYRDGELSGTVQCIDGSEATLGGQASNRQITLRITSAEAPAAERVVAQRRREFGGTLAAFFIAVAIVMLVARLAGAGVAKLGQPRVMGEVLAGICLGPTVLGAFLPDIQRVLFPSDVIPFIGVAANLGLIFYMFLVGLEIDLSLLRGRIAQTAIISNTGVVIPMLAGLAIAIPTYRLLGPGDSFAAFALFMGVAMSITAFPVLARILNERRMLTRPLGALALASAAIDDVTAWFLIALATAVAVAGSLAGVVQTILLAVAFCAVMGLGVRRIVARASVAYDEAGRVPVTWITAIFAGVLLSAYATEQIGIALIFGAFVMGTIMPRHAGLTEDVTRRLEDFVVLLLLPLFFAFTGLRTNVGLLDSPELILMTVMLIAVAIACKFGGTMLASRFIGMSWRESAVIGALMNTRGLTELIVLNLALEKGVISEALFASLVLLALVTTFLAGPVLRLLDPKNQYGAPVEDELPPGPAGAPDRSIVVAPQTEGAQPLLLELAEPLARSQPPRELILARILPLPRASGVRGALQTQQALTAEAAGAVERSRGELLTRGVTARGMAFTSSTAGEDLARLAELEDVDLILLDGRRPLLGGGVPRGDVGVVLDTAPCDVAVLVAREDATIALGPDAPILVPFGGFEHDWAALELAAWLASASGAPLRLLGRAGEPDSGRDAGRLLASASLLVQRFVGVAAESVISEPGRDAVLRAAEGASLLVIGLPDDWRSEGLGTTRAEIAASAPAPILFVRRGTLRGALAPRTDVTRFNWTSPATALGGRGGETTG